MKISRKQLEVISRAAYEANRAFCEGYGDYSNPPWADLDERAQRSSGVGVMLVVNKPDVTLEEQHEAWRTFRVEQGWKRGPVKDAHAKTHPALVPYNDLPVFQRSKDALFHAVVKGLLANIGHLGENAYVSETRSGALMEHVLRGWDLDTDFGDGDRFLDILRRLPPTHKAMLKEALG